MKKWQTFTHLATSQIITKKIQKCSKNVQTHGNVMKLVKRSLCGASCRICSYLTWVIFGKQTIVQSGHAKSGISRHIKSHMPYLYANWGICICPFQFLIKEYECVYAPFQILIMEYKYMPLYAPFWFMPQLGTPMMTAKNRQTFVKIDN